MTKENVSTTAVLGYDNAPNTRRGWVLSLSYETQNTPGIPYSARCHSYTSYNTRKLPSGTLRGLLVSSHLSLRHREGVSVGRLPIVRLYEHARGAHVLEVDDVRRPIPELSTNRVKSGRLFIPPGHGHSSINLALEHLNVR